ncbi:MAG: hypothetical protein ACJAW3_001032 [Lentimonas sp.]|jgi:hypothetical protein
MANLAGGAIKNIFDIAIGSMAANQGQRVLGNFIGGFNSGQLQMANQLMKYLIAIKKYRSDQELSSYLPLVGYEMLASVTEVEASNPSQTLVYCGPQLECDGLVSEAYKHVFELKTASHRQAIKTAQRR